MRLQRHPLHHLIGGRLRGGAKDIMIGAPDNSVLTQTGAILPEPTARPQPGDDWIEEAG